MLSVPLTLDEIATLRRLRLAQNWTWYQMAREVGLPPSTLVRAMAPQQLTLNERTAHRVRAFLCVRAAQESAA